MTDTPPAVTMIEKLAKALELAEEYCRLVQGFHYGDDFVMRDINRPHGEQEIHREPYNADTCQATADHVRRTIYVRAVLTALREPDEGMVTAGEHTDRLIMLFPDDGREAIKHIWPEIIDHILQEADRD